MVPVFNADQCQDLPERFYSKPGAPVGALAGPEAVLAAYEATPGRRYQAEPAWLVS